MTVEDRRNATDKADRALVLAEQGLSRVVIAERLGISPGHVNGMLHRAKQRRANRSGEVEA